MGEVDAATELVESVIKNSEPSVTCDQLACTLAFLSGNFKIVLDHDCRLFQSLYMADADVEWDESNKRMRNKLTKRNPLAFHGNGRADMRFVISHLGMNG